MSDPAPPTRDEIWPYIGIGCITVVAGFFGGGMIAVLIAKIVGAIRGCTPEGETGAPCGWYNYMIVGACSGMILLPTVAILLRRRGLRKQRNSL
jgi:hypothetical protein